ncbi:hypothetical protein BH23ACT9_BH23ACT9_03850 [soil metagenome]
MTALTAPHPGEHELAPEVLARRSLGLDAAFCTAVGSFAVVAAGPVGRAVALPAPVVRTAGVAAIGWGGVVGLWSVAEDWQPPTRRVLGANALGAAALVGHAAVKGTRGGRVGVLVLAAAVTGFAGSQLKALLAAEPSSS